MRYFTLKSINPVVFCGIIHELGAHSIRSYAVDEECSRKMVCRAGCARPAHHFSGYLIDMRKSYIFDLVYRNLKNL